MRLFQSLVLVALITFPVAADEVKKGTGKKQATKKPVSFWMEKKLQYAQDMLRGLSTGELDYVAERAEQIRVLSKVEGWIRSGKPGYKAQLQAFEFANDEIFRNAKAGNLEGTALGFQQLTTSCVTCHKILRDSES